MTSLWKHSISQKGIEAWFQRTTNRNLAYGESNAHVTDDVTWPREVKLLTPMHLEPISRKQLDLLFRNNRSLITRVCCEAIRSAILVTAWLLVVCVSIYVYLSTCVTPGLRPIGTPCPFSLQCPYNSTIIVREEKTSFKQQWRSNEVTNLLPHGLSHFSGKVRSWRKFTKQHVI